VGGIQYMRGKKSHRSPEAEWRVCYSADRY
jgi:hypothetical protein